MLRVCVSSAITETGWRWNFSGTMYRISSVSECFIATPCATMNQGKVLVAIVAWKIVWSYLVYLFNIWDRADLGVVWQQDSSFKVEVLNALETSLCLHAMSLEWQNIEQGSSVQWKSTRLLGVSQAQRTGFETPSRFSSRNKSDCLMNKKMLGLAAVWLNDVFQLIQLASCQPLNFLLKPQLLSSSFQRNYMRTLC